MVRFSDIVNFKYDAEEVDQDIRQLLKTGKFNPAYAAAVREFLAEEIENCQKAVNDDKNHLSVHRQGTMCEDALTRTPEEIEPVLNWLGYPADKREFWFDYFVHPKFGRQKAPPVSILQYGNRKEMLTPFGLATDAFYSVYTEIHELMHGVQGKYFTSEKEDKYQQDHYDLLYQGKSRDEAIAIQTAKNPSLRRELHYERCFKEMQANSAATCYMMLKAVETKDPDIISKVEKRLLNEAAAMSGALMNENLGLAYFEYPATKRIIEEIKQGKGRHLLNDKGLLNWPELYRYTQEKVEGMGYTKEDMLTSLETAKKLRKIRFEHPDNKEEFLQAVEKEKENLPYPHNKIFAQFVEAQRRITGGSDRSLHRFYDLLGVKEGREKRLADADGKKIPHIDEYRKIYRQAEYFKMLKKLSVDTVSK